MREWEARTGGSVLRTVAARPLPAACPTGESVDHGCWLTVRACGTMAGQQERTSRLDLSTPSEESSHGIRNHSPRVHRLPPPHPGSSPSFPGTCWGAAGTSLPATRSRWPTSAWAPRDSANSAACSPTRRSRSSPSATRTPTATTTWSGASTAFAVMIRNYLGNPTWRENDHRLSRRPRGGPRSSGCVLREATGRGKIPSLLRLCRLPRTAGARSRIWTPSRS